MKRREFVQRLPVVASTVLAGVGSVSLASCAGIPYVTPRPRAGGLAVDGVTLGDGGAAFLRAPTLERPIFLRLTSDGDAVALLASCTHRGCQPEPVGDRLICPCHGSEFDLTGDVLQGPADRPLTRYEVTREGDEYVVWLERRVR
jgi:thiosulfate dehydrogenase [quinone] large subunit